MSKVLTFVDGTTLNVGDASTATSIVVPVENFAAVDQLKVKFAADNTEKIELDGTVYHNMVPAGIDVTATADGIPTAVFGFHVKSELEILQERLDEQEEMINALLMG